MSAPNVARLLFALVCQGPALSVEQAQGNACVWCPRTLLHGDRVALGGGGSWWPQACRPCYAARSQVVSTYIAWNDHLLLCAACAAGRCDTDATLRTAHLAARECIGREAVWCLNCATFARGGAFRPFFWESRRGPELSYVHVECHRTRTRPVSA
ncbi:hypothetical protein AB0I84_47985 [Streptomyces spectabilis]|uniref:hypothetical protein n=1 Tax=Streptomyces spectabilis TaxID=68270 RepID=UPI0033DC0C46